MSYPKICTQSAFVPLDGIFLGEDVLQGWVVLFVVKTAGITYRKTRLAHSRLPEDNKLEVLILTNLKVRHYYYIIVYQRSFTMFVNFDNTSFS